jgi:hypothetical protein
METHQPYEVINEIISTLAFAWVVGLIARYSLSSEGSSNVLIRGDNSHRELTGAGWGLILWGGWWLSLAIVYFLLSGYTGSNLSLLLWPNDLGNLAALAGALAYCRGDAFHKRDLIPFGGAAVLLLVVSGSVAFVIPGSTGRMVAIAPSAVLSTVAIVAMGWSVLVRCGWGTSPFLIGMWIYACLQVPAYIDAFVLRGTGAETQFPGVTRIFYVLALFKIVVLLAFLGYFLSPDHKLDALKQERAWPTDGEGVHMRKEYRAVLKWGVGLVGGVIGGVATQNLGGIKIVLINVLRRLSLL